MNALSGIKRKVTIVIFVEFRKIISSGFEVKRKKKSDQVNRFATYSDICVTVISRAKWIRRKFEIKFSCAS